MKFTNEVLQATAAFCGAVAVSAYEPQVELVEVLRKLASHSIKVNVHFILDSASVDTALHWLEGPPSFLSEVNAIIFLNYKPVGRGGTTTRLLKRNIKVQAFLEMALNKQRTFKIGFDSCMVSGLTSSGIVNPIWYDACEAARFSMYVSEAMQAYPCSFMEASYEGICLTEDNMLKIWQEAHLFRQVRNTLRQPACKGHPCVALCRGGCPIFPEINLCDQGVHGKKRVPIFRV